MTDNERILNRIKEELEAAYSCDLMNCNGNYYHVDELNYHEETDQFSVDGRFYDDDECSVTDLDEYLEDNVLDASFTINSNAMLINADIIFTIGGPCIYYHSSTGKLVYDSMDETFDVILEDNVEHYLDEYAEDKYRELKMECMWG